MGINRIAKVTATLVAVVACMGADNCGFGGPRKPAALVGCKALSDLILAKCGSMPEDVIGSCINPILEDWLSGPGADERSKAATDLRARADVCLANEAGCRVTATWTKYITLSNGQRMQLYAWPSSVSCTDSAAANYNCRSPIGNCLSD